MTDASMDAVVLSQPQHVYWASGYRPHWLQQAEVVVTADGLSVLIAASGPAHELAVDEVRTFQASRHGTQSSEQPALAAAAALEWLATRRPRRVGVDAGMSCVEVARQLGPVAVDFSPTLYALRRPKDADEMALIGRAIDCTKAMYAAAREIIEPGTGELDVFNALHAAAVRTAGEPLTAILGNDFACGVPGGPARGGHVAAAGQLYILDLGPAYRGYFADTCRTFSVDRKPTDVQRQASAAIASAFEVLEAAARPGVRCVELYEHVNRQLRDDLGIGLTHHLGHGVGLEPHEAPHLNPKWDDVLIEGDVFTAEPGVYSDALNGGIRVENMYAVTKTGVQNLTRLSTELL